MTTAGRVAWYRLRATFAHRWGGYLAIVLLVGLLGGLALAAVSGARRTQSSFPAFLRTTNPSDMDIDVGQYDPGLMTRIARLPQVSSISSYVSLNLAPITAAGQPSMTNPFGNLEVVGSLNGLYFDRDRVTIVAGRAADPGRADEIVVSKYAAKLFGLRVGETESLGAFSNAEVNGGGFPTKPPVLRIVVRIVGIGLFNDEVIQDDVDRLPRALFTPALADRLVSCCSSYAWSGLQLKGGGAQAETVESEYLRLLPAGDPYYFHVTSIIEAQGEQALKPESIALGVFGLIAALAALLIGGQAISRRIDATARDRDVLRSLGADPTTTAADTVLGIAFALVGAVLLAALVAVALSPLELIGPVRSVISSPGFAIDWTVVGFGVLALLVILTATTVLLARRDAPDRAASRARPARGPDSAIVQATIASGLPIAAGAGVRFAFDSGRGRRSVASRSAIVGAVLAVVATVAALVFGSSLNTLVSTPRLYGWNWSYALEADAGYGAIPQAKVDQLLTNDPSVAAESGVYFETFTFDGLGVPVLGATPQAAVQPPVLSGHGLDGPGEVVLGPATMAQLHKRVGDTLVARYTTHVTTLRIVGTATMPAVGIGHGLHLSLGVGAVIDYTLIPSAARNIQDLPAGGPNMVFVRFKDGADPGTAEHALEQVASELSSGNSQLSVLVVPVQRPAQIVNYRSMGTTPALLAAGLGLGAFCALAVTLTESVRRHRRDLALFKAFGFTRRQLAATAAWQASITVAIGTLVGVPLGIIAGRGLWDLFAHQFYAIAEPTIPGWNIVLLVGGALVLANVVAAIPGRQAARTPTALLLHAE